MHSVGQQLALLEWRALIGLEVVEIDPGAERITGSREDQHPHVAVSFGLPYSTGCS